MRGWISTTLRAAPSHELKFVKPEVGSTSIDLADARTGEVVGSIPLSKPMKGTDTAQDAIGEAVIRWKSELAHLGSPG